MKFPTRTKPTTASALATSTPGVQFLDQLDARLKELKDRHDAVLAEILRREGAGEKRGKLPEVQNAAIGRAMSLLGGTAAAASDAPGKTCALDALYQEQGDLLAAIDLGRRRSFQLAGELVADLVGPELVAWHDLIRNMALAAARLLNLTHRSHDLRLEIMRKSRGGEPSLIGAPDILSTTNDGPAHELIQIALREALVTPAEIKEA
jgi:hypothetical protein